MIDPRSIEVDGASQSSQYREKIGGAEGREKKGKEKVNEKVSG